MTELSSHCLLILFEENRYIFHIHTQISRIYIKLWRRIFFERPRAVHTDQITRETFITFEEDRYIVTMYQLLIIYMLGEAIDVMTF